MQTAKGERRKLVARQTGPDSRRKSLDLRNAPEANMNPTATEKAFDAGYDCAVAGLSMDNPYRYGSRLQGTLYTAWKAGYEKAVTDYSVPAHA